MKGGLLLIYKLLESKLKTNLSILDEIYNNNNWTTTAIIAEKLTISERTVQHYLKDIFDSKKKFDQETPNELEISYLKTKGIRIIDYKNEFDDFKKFTIQNSPTIILLIDIINHKMTSVSKYAQQHFISETTVRKSLNRIKQTCQDYGIDIQRFQLTGNEEKIRFFILLIFKMTGRELFYQIEGIDSKKVEDVFANLFSKMPIKLSKMKKIRLINRFLVHLQRIKFNKKVSFNEDIIIQLKRHEYYSAVSKLFHNFLVFDETEITFYFYAITLDHELHRNEVTNIVYNYYKKNDLPIFKNTIIIFNKIDPLLKPLPPETKEILIQNLFYINYLTSKYSDLAFDYKYSMNVHYDLKRHTSLCETLTIIINEHLVNEQIISSKCLDTLLQQYLFRILYFLDPKHLDKVINIYIETTFDQFQQNQIKEYLNLFFSHQVHYVDSLDDEMVDMVLTPYQEVDQKNIYPSKLVTRVKYPLTISLLKNIETKLNYL